jgi:hypothetical protein
MNYFVAGLHFHQKDIHTECVYVCACVYAGRHEQILIINFLQVRLKKNILKGLQDGGHEN